MAEAKKAYFNAKNTTQRKRLVRKYTLSNIVISTLVFVVLIVIDTYAILFKQLSLTYSLIVVAVSLIMYLILIITLTSTNYFKTINRRGKNDVIKAIVNEVGKESRKDIANESKYVGSSQNKTYHLRDCKVAKNIKPKFRLENNSEAFFVKNKFKAHKCVKI